MSRQETTTQLIDRFGRQVTYLRISVTDRCDFRCVYCMSEKMQFLPRAEVLRLEEIAAIARAFTGMGVDKIRVTGGEPLVRHNIIALLQELGRLPGLRELALTTNGSQLTRYAGDLKACGVRRINISLDSLRADRFRKITRRGNLDRVLAGIEAARETNFAGLKINAVILKNRNHDEVCDLARFAGSRGLDISYIEEMPLGQIDEHNRAEAYYSSDRILEDLRREFQILPTAENTGGPSRYYRNVDTGTRIGFISPHSHNFCASCNRVRLTCQGRLLLCLGQEHSADLRQVVRSQPGDEEVLRQAIRDAMEIKPRGHEFQLDSQPKILRYMNLTGG